MTFQVSLKEFLRENFCLLDLYYHEMSNLLKDSHMYFILLKTCLVEVGWEQIELLLLSQSLSEEIFRIGVHSVGEK